MAERLIEPTEEERANGWDAPSLTKYIRERESAQSKFVLERPPVRPASANGRYSPFAWRK